VIVSNISAGALEALAYLHKFDYQWPKDLNTPLFPIKRAVMDDNGTILAAATLKVEAEAYLWVDNSSNDPQKLWEGIQALHEDIRVKALKIGFDQVHCSLPPEVSGKFAQRLESLGWKQARPWPFYVFQLR